MVRALHLGHSILKSVSGKRHAHNLLTERQGSSNIRGEEGLWRQNSISADHLSENLQTACDLGWMDNKKKVGEAGAKERHPPSDMEMMKERFAKLLLGEDMSGGGKGVSSALALSNAITNLAASVFGEQSRLEPMPAETKARWRREIDWLLSVTDHIVEFVPTKQKSKGGLEMEVMTTRQRIDLLMNIPALRKLDAMLLDTLDNFKDQDEFWYVKRNADNDKKENSEQRHGDKWWLPQPKVPPEGLSEVSRKWLQFQKESVNQVLKAALAINAQILSEMEIPEDYIESLPKEMVLYMPSLQDASSFSSALGFFNTQNGRASLGDAIYRSITDEYFNPEEFLSTQDLSTEHKVLDLKNKIEASIVIWKRKMHNKDRKSSWASGVSIENRELFEERAETILVIIKQRFPGIPQSTLDISKIQYNRDVGQSVLESYSRILETLAHTVMSRIDDVLYADSLTQNPSLPESKNRLLSYEVVTGPVKFPNAEEEREKLNAMAPPPPMTLSDFMGWHFDQEEMENNLGNKLNSEDEKSMKKPPSVVTGKKYSYLENLGGVRSPTARH